MWESAKSVSAEEPASKQTNSGDAQSTSEKTRSGAKLKISPKKLPKPPLEPGKAKRLRDMDKDSMLQVQDFFRAHTYRIKDKWIRRKK
mgnify:CR=1 FL=1